MYANGKVIGQKTPNTNENSSNDVLFNEELSLEAPIRKKYRAANT